MRPNQAVKTISFICVSEPHRSSPNAPPNTTPFRKAACAKHSGREINRPRSLASRQSESTLTNPAATQCGQSTMDEHRTSASTEPLLTPEDESRLRSQDARLVPAFKAQQLERDAKKHWDLFYKRNETRFFRDRHWTTREFRDLLHDADERRTLWEIGCGVGNFVFPLIEAKLNFEYIVSDLSSRAIELVRAHELYDEDIIRALQADITDPDIVNRIPPACDVATLIFVLSAIHPEKFVSALRNIHRCLKPGGVLLFRDYGLYDMAQLRFKAGHKIAENFYMRQDGTRTYYYSVAFVNEIMTQAGFQVVHCDYVHRRTINQKENVDVSRIFVQGKFKRGDI